MREVLRSPRGTRQPETRLWYLDRRNQRFPPRPWMGAVVGVLNRYAGPVVRTMEQAVVRVAGALAATQAAVPQYAQSQAAFFQEYAASHKKLSELGVKWNAAPVAYP